MFHHLRKLLLSLVPTKGTRTSAVFLPPLPLQHLSNADHLQTHKLDSMGLWTEQSCLLRTDAVARPKVYEH